MNQNGQPCISCDSSDAMTIYEGGDGYCFSCKTYFFPDQIEKGEAPESSSKASNSEAPIGTGPPANVPSRALQEASLAYYGVGCEYEQTNRELKGLVFPVYRDGQLTGTKTKYIGAGASGYTGTGGISKPDFFGQHRAGQGGKLLIITEGEVDAMSAHQLLRSQGKAYNVVSLPNGANVAAARQHIEWLESFETIALNLDNDKPGQDCAKAIGDLLTPGKVKIMTLPDVKDANEFLVEGGNPKMYLKALWNAKPYRPDGVVSLSESWDAMFASDSQSSVPYPWYGLNDKLYGIREREIVTLTAGSGIGKSAVVRELEHWLLKETQDNIGILALEESVGRTAWGIVSVEANLPLSIREERVNVDTADIKKWYDATLGTGRVYTLDHFGSTSEGNLLSKVRYMIKGLQCKWIVLDHLSIVVSAQTDIGDERKAIDSIMTKLRQLVEETGAGLILVSHLRRIDGNRGHEQGVEVSLNHLRGSQSISQLSDAVVALERNQQAETEKEANLTLVRVIKNRYAGLTGIAAHLAYIRETGRLLEIPNVLEYLAPETSEHNF